MSKRPICLIHGAATTASIWDGLVSELSRRAPRAQIRRPDRAASGSLDGEVEALIGYATGALVVGVSGGATLGLELAARGVPFDRAILHEPAVGSLQPGQLDAVAAAYARGGVPEFGRTLYGPSWRAEFAPLDPAAVSRDLSMFRRFEPRAPASGSGRVIITVGAQSPPARHAAAAALADRFGYEVRVLADSRHAVHLDAPAIFAELIVGFTDPVADRG